MMTSPKTEESNLTWDDVARFTVSEELRAILAQCDYTRKEVMPEWLPGDTKQGDDLVAWGAKAEEALSKANPARRITITQAPSGTSERQIKPPASSGLLLSMRKDGLLHATGFSMNHWHRFPAGTPMFWITVERYGCVALQARAGGKNGKDDHAATD
jgi:hypothetical protein